MVVNSVYYNYEDNTFIDDDGEFFGDIHRYIPPCELRFCKEKGGTFYKKCDVEDVVYEFVFTLEEDEY
jgi:hypothetical protein